NARDTRTLQENILKSHAVGVGDAIQPRLSKLMLVLKIHALAQGYSGVKVATVERLIWHLDQHLIPVVPQQGSVGASGDLAPLSHLFLPLIGHGEIWKDGKQMPADLALKESKCRPLVLGPKEGLALINGTQFMTAHGIVALEELRSVMDHADLIGALMIEGLNGSIKPFREELHQLRPFKGTQYTAATIFNLLNGSAIQSAHQQCAKVQDPYSMRCIPQVHGATRNAWLHVTD